MSYEVGRRQSKRSVDGLMGGVQGSQTEGVRQPRLRTENGLSSPLGGVDGAEMPPPGSESSFGRRSIGNALASSGSGSFAALRMTHFFRSGKAIGGNVLLQLL
jgi:hypothetical protein